MKSLKELSQLPLHERERLHKLTQFERKARRVGFYSIAGLDEAGRGPLAGPVVAAACILPEDFFLPGIDDSKKLTPKKRVSFFDFLTSQSSIQYGVGVISHEVIDQVNILEATKLAMLQAIDRLPSVPDYLLIDAVELKKQSIPYQSIIKGDCLSQSIAAASVIAKETRDRMMVEYDRRWPQYGFSKHKGYGTKVHREAIQTNGPCPIHRRSFEPIKSLVRDWKGIN